MPGPTLEFASICLQNALFLLPPLPPSNGDEQEDERNIPTVNALPGPPIKGQSILDLKSVNYLFPSLLLMYMYMHYLHEDAFYNKLSAITEIFMQA